MREVAVLPLVRGAPPAERQGMAIALVVAFLLVLNLLVPWFGVDSRDGRDWQDR